MTQTLIPQSCKVIPKDQSWKNIKVYREDCEWWATFPDRNYKLDGLLATDPNNAIVLSFLVGYTTVAQSEGKNFFTPESVLQEVQIEAMQLTAAMNIE